MGFRRFGRFYRSMERWNVDFSMLLAKSPCSNDEMTLFGRFPHARSVESAISPCSIDEKALLAILAHGFWPIWTHMEAI